MAALNGFGKKFGRKIDQNFTNFFFQKKTNIKRAQKPSFIKIVNIGPILALPLQDMKNPLPLKVGSTVSHYFGNIYLSVNAT